VSAPLAETRQDIDNLREQIAVLRQDLETLDEQIPAVRQDLETLHEQIPAVRQDLETLHEQIPVLQQDMARHYAALLERIANLEVLLLEHPKAQTGNATVLTGKGAIFPSPVVSIVMPTWNRANIVGQAIESVLAQSYTDWELIVTDDGSTDNTEETVARFADPRIRFQKQAHAGQGVARNHALQFAKGALISYLDSDDVWYPGFLACAVAAFAADASIECAYGALISEVHQRDSRLLYPQFDRDKLLKGNFIGLPSFVHRREVYERFGGFDEALTRLIDWDLILRFTQDQPARRLPVLAVRVRRMDDTRVSDTADFERNYETIVRKWSVR
jgi:hypothetical protein